MAPPQQSVLNLERHACVVKCGTGSTQVRLVRANVSSVRGSNHGRQGNDAARQFYDFDQWPRSASTSCAEAASDLTQHGEFIKYGYILYDPVAAHAKMGYGHN